MSVTATTPHESTGAQTGEAPYAAMAGKYMTFRLANEDYGVEILNVREIIGIMEITRVPRAPDFIRGVINLRGKVMPVWDLRQKFGMESVETTDQTVIIVVQCQHGETNLTMGVLVDEVLEVLNITAEQIAPPPDFGACMFDATFIVGVGKVDARVIFLLDIAKVVTAEETEAMAKIANEFSGNGAQVSA